MVDDSLKRDFGWLFLRALELTDKGQYDLAERTLNEYHEAHKDADSDDWLRNSVLSALADVRRTKGDYEGAIDFHRKVHWPVENALAFLMNAQWLAMILIDLGRGDEAVNVIEMSLATARGGSLESYMPLVRLLLDVTDTALPLWL